VIEKALDLARQGAWAGYTADALNENGQCDLRGKALAKAEVSFTEALEIAIRAGYADRIVTARRGLAEIARLRGRHAMALDHLKAAIEAVEHQRTQIPNPQFRIGFLRQNFRVYEDAVDELSILHERQPTRGYDRQAFGYAERARARSFLDMLAEGKAQITKGLTEAQAREQRVLEAEVSQAMRALTGDNSERDRKAAEAAEQKLAEWVTLRRIENPRYYALRYPEPFDAAKAQAVAASEEAVILEYVLGERRSHLWVISPSSVHMTSLPARSFIERTVRRYRQAIARHPTGDRLEEFRDTARQLFSMLITPAMPRLRPGQRLIVSPDGILHYLPFETLMSTNRESRFLIEDFTVTYTPSVSVLAALRDHERTETPTHELLAYGDPLFSRASGGPGKSRAELVRAVYENSGIRFPQLPNTRKEVNSIAALFPAHRRRTYLGGDATEGSVKREKLGNYRRIHFATHAVIDEQFPGRSGIVLSLVDSGNEDGILRLNEILNLELAADLVVLSACQTGLGENVRGEGIVGLTRAFLYAGSPRAVVSLWDVDDQMAPDFMSLFYKQVTFGQRPSDALRKAKLAMIRSDFPALRHPYFWAPFTLTGLF
jgi:CHAT domain-containing protein